MPLFIALFLGKLCAQAVSVQVATSKPTYFPGERLEVLVSVPEPATLLFPTSLQTLYTMDGAYTPAWSALGVLTQASTPRTWTNIHSWSDYNLSPGNHTVIGTVVGYGTSAPVTFNVVQPPSPQGDFLIDFDTIPGTTASVAHLMAYDACGVHFHTKQGAAMGLHDVAGNSWVQGFDAYPTGFHVIADFAIPVFGASAKVAGGTSVTITMVAKNSQGQTIATNTSVPVVHPGQFEQSLSVTTTEPIASLEWWPSIPNSACRVDDLFVVRTPPLNARAVGDILCLTWPTVSGENYQLWSSTDLQTWSPWGSPRAGNGGMLTNDCSMTGAPALFFRVSKSD